MKNHHEAVVFGPDGSKQNYIPKFTRGDAQTQQFAASATEAMRYGGISISVSNHMTPSAIKEALAYLQSL